MEPNRAIELHDTKVTGVSWVGRDLHVAIDAYVHASNGVPAVDAGSGWIWPGVLVVEAGQLVGEAPDELTISHGGVMVGDEEYDNVLPLPFDRAGTVVVDLRGADGRLTLSGSGVRFVATGEARWVDRFEP